MEYSKASLKKILFVKSWSENTRMEYKDVCRILLTLSLSTFNFSTIFLFAYFMSSHSFLHYPLKEPDRAAESTNGSDWNSLLIDFLLLCAFMLQHSLQARFPLKLILHENIVHVFERLIYTTFTCALLQLVMYFWQPVHGWVLWDIDIMNNYILYWTFNLFHVGAWISIYTGCLLFDMPELMGFKQVYYHIRGWPSPLSQKTPALLRLYRNMRHPGFTALTLIALGHPVMQADRFMLAYVFAIYMILAFRIDWEDCTYHRRQLRIKKAELEMSFHN